ncbi:MAG: hypothetical protein HC872_02485 [Gammaproteobacteria bacterium]|nr:hypothetical protein [Gammaproteobacteria bacterium]
MLRAQHEVSISHLKASPEKIIERDHSRRSGMSRAAAGDPFFEKGLPSNIEAERSILGAILLDNSVCNQAVELLKRDDFFFRLSP